MKNVKWVKNMYKFVAIDLDGTLLDSCGEISLKNKESIKKATKNGVIVVLASRKNATICEKHG